METRVDRKLGLRPGRKCLDDPVAPSELIHRFQSDWTILVFRIRPRRFLPINRTQSFGERTRIDMHIARRMDIAGAAALVCTRTQVCGYRYVYASPVPRVHPPVSNKKREERETERAIYYVFAARARPRSAAISCVAVIEYLKMSGNVQDGGEGKLSAFETTKGIGMEKLRAVLSLETMHRIKNAARSGKTNSIPFLRGENAGRPLSEVGGVSVIVVLPVNIG